ncbi:MAG: membrane dipeptidase [Clostridiaceae bacterium]|jgi:membrane dipeptidase|nr:membrane dipeptidase [Clostridiaceae bacterium]
MLIVDAHCDTALSVYENNSDLYENPYHLDIRRLLETGSRVQFFAAFVEPRTYMNNTLAKVLSIIDVIYNAQEKHSDKIKVCLNTSDIKNAVSENMAAAILSIEGGECLNGELSVLRQLYRLGVRSMLLAWNYRNLLADGAEELHGAGLSAFGRQVVTEMNRLGMLVDVSHLCEASFNDVLSLTTAPVIASHSNSKAVCDNERNLTDAQLMKIKDNGGVAGLNFYPFFLNNTKNADIDDVVRHIEHICSVTGEEHIGIGADYDGIECTPSGLEGTQCIPALFDRLLQLNYSGSFIEKLAGGNFMRVIEQVLQ